MVNSSIKGVLPFPPIPARMRPSIDAYWAALLACPEALLYPTQTVIFHSPQSPGVLGLQTQRHWLFAVAPSVTIAEATRWVRRVLPLLAIGRTWLRLWPALGQKLRRLLWSWAVPRIGRHTTLTDLYGPAYVLYCSQVMPYARCTVTIRPITMADQPAVQHFQQAMNSVAWSLDQPQLWPRVCGIFQDDRLVAAGAVRLWAARIGEIFVDTLPRYRRRGYARALAGHLTEWMLRETAWLPQYDAEAHNLPSLRVARVVGYQYYGMMFLGTLARTC